jgi:hypothetical protein
LNGSYQLDFEQETWESLSDHLLLAVETKLPSAFMCIGDVRIITARDKQRSASLSGNRTQYMRSISEKVHCGQSSGNVREHCMASCSVAQTLKSLVSGFKHVCYVLAGGMNEDISRTYSKLAPTGRHHSLRKADSHT